MTQAPERTPQGERLPQRNPKAARSSQKAMWFLLLPSLVPVLVFSVYPLANGIWLGFTDARAGFDVQYKFNGFANYTKLLHDDLFWNSFKIGLIWAVTVTVIQFLLALGLAMLLNAGLRFQWLVRPLALVPWAMPSVIVAILWKLIYHPDAGILNAVLRWLHIIDHNISWLGSFDLALPAVIVVGVWAGMPQTTIALLAGLQNTPGELHEAAALDGANAWQRFLTVTWPAIKPVAIAITSLDFVWNFNSFGLVYVLTDGGPGGRTLLPMLFAYQRAFGNGEFGYAAALGNVMVIVIVAIMGGYLWRQMREAS
ncbi:carbohydrate ABC transporter membrane protein 1, CUT1 family [Pedococcus dokdonensis]|uniref:Carbohydrate ABC transporter membrane protein 1, CUT1 family n=1 Tax=Pedococcus dokdonensis TaxID=443156 RepID=A0A1H0TX98_9MICO|nr:sugar ABC transporter permease [Pedococcus dokdonensis]SDP58298.1 carbohydrate ABC transporter membrane protein 1, CUT1 family [Pedococcus dokdonensis]